MLGQKQRKTKTKPKTKPTQIFVSMFRNCLFFFLSKLIFMFIYSCLCEMCAPLRHLGQKLLLVVLLEYCCKHPCVSNTGKERQWCPSFHHSNELDIDDDYYRHTDTEKYERCICAFSHHKKCYLL